jgi:hypothetical protein
MSPEGAPAALHEKIAAGRAAVLQRLSRAARPIADQDAELTARVLSALSDEYARLVLTDPDRFTPERLVEHARWWLNGTPLARLPKREGRSCLGGAVRP